MAVLRGVEMTISVPLPLPKLMLFPLFLAYATGILPKSQRHNLPGELPPQTVRDYPHVPPPPPLAALSVPAL